MIRCPKIVLLASSQLILVKYGALAQVPLTVHPRCELNGKEIPCTEAACGLVAFLGLVILFFILICFGSLIVSAFKAGRKAIPWALRILVFLILIEVGSKFGLVNTKRVGEFPSGLAWIVDWNPEKWFACLNRGWNQLLQWF